MRSEMKTIISISSIHFRRDLQKVLDNIIASVRRQPRDIELLIYYPTFEYQKAIRDCNLFVLKKMIKLSGYEEDPDEKVLVYHLSRYFVA